MCGPGAEVLEHTNSEEEYNQLKKLNTELNELNRLAQLYHKEEQWALLDKVIHKMNIWTHMISTHMDGMSEEGLLEVDNEQV